MGHLPVKNENLSIIVDLPFLAMVLDKQNISHSHEVFYLM